MDDKIIIYGKGNWPYTKKARSAYGDKVVYVDVAKNKDKLEIIFREFIPLYFQSIQEYNILKEEYLHFHNFFLSCNKLKIFNINSMIEIIQNEELVETIYLTKENKLEKSFEKFKPYKITIKKTINDIIEITNIHVLDFILISQSLISFNYKLFAYVSIIETK